MAIATIQTTASRQELTGVVEQAKRAWRAGQTPDIAGVIREHPDVLHHRTFVVDLAYEAYCLREASGQTPETTAFLQEMPAFRTQIREVILGHRELADHFPTADLEPATWPTEGDRLESLTIQSELGRGSFARVYLAQDSNLGNRKVVLKLSAVPSYEGHALGTIKHPNIVNVLWARKLGGLFAICMPYVGGTTLGDIVQSVSEDGRLVPRRAGAILNSIEKTSVIPANDLDRQLQPIISTSESYVRAIARIGLPLAEALAYLHDKGIVHGDIKPSNILLDRSARPYLIDFNMARREDDWLLRFGGTLPYMAPEVLDPSRPKCSLFAAEVYSLGLVLYHSLTGRLPHEPSGTDLRDVAKEQFARKKIGCAPIRSLNRQVPRRMARAIDACLSVEPSNRLSATQLALELRAITTPRRWLRVFGIFLGVLLLAAAGKSVFLPNANPSKIPEFEFREGPSTHEEYFERGVASLRRNDFASAMMDFDAARAIKADGKTLAHMGYCLSKTGKDRDAESFYGKAIFEGYSPAWVHNNRAFSLMQFGQNLPAVMKRALESAQLAREIDPGRRQISFNWVLARFLVAMEGRPRALKDSECLQVLRSTLAEGPVDADLYIKSALVLSASGPENHREAVSLLHKAVSLGRSPNSILRDPYLRFHMAKNDDFLGIERLTYEPKSQVALELRLMTPVE